MKLCIPQMKTWMWIIMGLDEVALPVPFPGLMGAPDKQGVLDGGPRRDQRRLRLLTSLVEVPVGGR